MLMLDKKTIRQQIDWATEALYNVSCSARLDSEILLAHCLDKNRSYLMTWPEKELTVIQQDCFKDLIGRRLQPQPIAYLVGYKEFYSLDFITTTDTLVPRPETELLVDTIIELVAFIDKPKILELGTGTGAIAVAVKNNNLDAEVVATDISQAALQVAQANALQHGAEICFVESDWYQTVDKTQEFDVIVSNPPYIAEHDPYLSQGDLPAEPQQALCSGITGLEALQSIVQGAKYFLKPEGWLVLEHGYDQQQAMLKLMLEAGFNEVSTYKDFNQLPRMTVGQKPI